MSIILKNVYLDIPIYGVKNKSFKRSLISSTHLNKFHHNDSNKVVSVRALSNISIALSPGDRLGISGNNGSGKTTLLRLLAGIYKPTSGEIKIDGNVSSLLSLTLGLDPEETGYQNIISKLRTLGVNKININYHLEEIIDFCELDEFICLPMRTYSSGMFMRVAFAIATSVDSDVILMDEWLSVGDSSFIEKAEHRLKNYLKNSPIVVMASHNRDLLNSFATKQIHLHNGSIQN
jgi:lipopolysaccharide transport system ATP-binding protein